MFSRTNPYRGTVHDPTGMHPTRSRTYTAERVTAQSLLLCWSLLRVALCLSKGIDADAVLAVGVAAAVGLTLASSMRGARRELEAKSRPKVHLFARPGGT